MSCRQFHYIGFLYQFGTTVSKIVCVRYFENTSMISLLSGQGTSIKDVPRFSAIFYLPTYLVLLYNVRFWGLSWTPLPTLISDVINGRSLTTNMPQWSCAFILSQQFFRAVNNNRKYCATSEKIASSPFHRNLALNISSWYRLLTISRFHKMG